MGGERRKKSTRTIKMEKELEDEDRAGGGKDHVKHVR